MEDLDARVFQVFNSNYLGFIQEIGPYVIDDGAHYKNGDKLTENPQTWQKYSNLLFLESPAGVGYSYSNDKTFKYNDLTTGNDNLAAILDFYSDSKFAELRAN